jgi:methionyl-tRNA synthetase
MDERAMTASPPRPDVSPNAGPKAALPTFYITTAISYPNGVPHIGHAYEAIATDAIARFKRLDGYDVFFLTGTDEHGLKMKQTAAKEGVPVQDLADRNAARFEALAGTLGLSHDRFIRTTEEQHYRSCEALWRRLDKAGDIYLDGYAGWYSVRDEAYYNETETTVGTDGVRVGPQGTPVEWAEEKTFFFRLKKYQEALLAHYEAHPEFIQPIERRNEILSFVKGGLEDLSVSRTTLDWGIPVPDAPGHVMYVWIDALNNYTTGVGFPDETSPTWRFWPADVHVIGKDITRFHTVYWPAFLMSAGLPIPKRVFGHGFVLNKGEKMSKSVGNVLDPFDLVAAFGVDQTRFFFLREVSFGQDGNYSQDAIVNRINADLANGLGNLAQRSLSMIFKNCEGKIPAPGDFTDADKALLASADALLGRAREAMDTLAIHKVLDAAWSVVSDGDRYVASEEPWSKKKTDPKRMETILYVVAEVVRQIAILAQPAMPASCNALLDTLSIAPDARTFAHLGAAHRLVPGTEIPEPKGVFPRWIDPEEAARRATQPPKSGKPGKAGTGKQA